MDTIKTLDDINQDRNDLPTMIIHGDDDRILPADVTSRRQAKLIKGVKFIEIKGALTASRGRTPRDQYRNRAIPHLRSRGAFQGRATDDEGGCSGN